MTQPYPAPNTGQPPATPHKPRAAIAIVAIAAILGLALIAWSIIRHTPNNTTTPSATGAETTSETTPTPTDTTPAETTPATTETTHPNTGPGIVAVGDTFTDDAMGITITITQAGTNWLPAQPTTAKGPDPYNIRMIGFEAQTDLKHAKYLNSDINGTQFTIKSPDGNTVHDIMCQNLYAASSPDQTAAIVTAISGGQPGAQPYSGDLAGGAGKGWLVCFTATHNDTLFQDGAGYTLVYQRPAMADQKGNPIPASTHTTTIA